MKLTSRRENVLVSEFFKVIRCNDSLKFCIVQHQKFARSAMNVMQLLSGCSGRALNVSLVLSQRDIDSESKELFVLYQSYASVKCCC